MIANEVIIAGSLALDDLQSSNHFDSQHLALNRAFLMSALVNSDKCSRLRKLFFGFTGEAACPADFPDDFEFPVSTLDRGRSGLVRHYLSMHSLAFDSVTGVCRERLMRQLEGRSSDFDFNLFKHAGTLAGDEGVQVIRAFFQKDTQDITRLTNEGLLETAVRAQTEGGVGAKIVVYFLEEISSLGYGAPRERITLVERGELTRIK